MSYLPQTTLNLLKDKNPDKRKDGLQDVENKITEIIVMI